MNYGDFLKDAKKYQEAAFLLSLWFAGKDPLFPLIDLWQKYKKIPKQIQQKLF
jgi:hypothetical protein